MSALGHKQTYAPQQAMSALPPIATEKADFRKRSCLLYPRKQTCAAHPLMSALGQKRTSAPQQRERYSITSSAAVSRVVGTVSPSAFAVLRLIVSSNLVGACTGSSAGFAPLECGPHSPPSAGRYRQNLAHRTSAHHQQRTAARAQCEAAGAAPVPRGS